MENNGENYYVFSYNDTNGFECLMNETVNGNGYQSARGVYVDNTLYVVMETLSKPTIWQIIRK